MSVWPESATAARDRGLERLHTLTVACAAGATALVAVLSVLAATTIPGHSSGAPAGSGSASTGGSTQDDQGQNLAQNQNLNPFGGFFGGGGGTPVAVSGGSSP
ncbi:MAG: hypothetical protein ACHQ0J_10950 [Candidatus Dormibacterales bacterium]